MVLMIVKSEIFRSRKFATVSMPRDYLSESENASVEVFFRSSLWFCPRIVHALRMKS